jgi:hypothetical protein
MTETKEHDNNVAETNKDDEDDVLDVEVIPQECSRIYERNIPFLWLMVGIIWRRSILRTHICFVT